MNQPSQPKTTEPRQPTAILHKSVLHIAEPCHESWDGMSGDDAKRFCDSCSKHVHHLSGMTRREARTLLATPRDEGLCVRYAHDADGALLFRQRRVSATAPRAQLEGAARLLAHAAVVASVFGACAWPVAEASEIAGGIRPIEHPLQGEPALVEPKPTPDPPAPPACDGDPDVEGSGGGSEEPTFMGMEPMLMGDIALPTDQLLEIQEDAAAQQLEPFGITLDEVEIVCTDGDCAPEAEPDPEGQPDAHADPDGLEVIEVIDPMGTQPEIMGRMPLPEGWKPGR